MILSHKNKDGYIHSYFEYQIVDEHGVPSNNGEYMYVRDLWVHHTLNGKKEISKYITEADKREDMKYVKHIYWLRSKYKDGKVVSQRLSKAFSRTICLHQKEM